MKCSSIEVNKLETIVEKNNVKKDINSKLLKKKKNHLRNISNYIFIISLRIKQIILTFFRSNY